MSADVAAIVLAAGQGTRFRSDTAKVLHRVAGRSLLGHVLEAVRPLDLGQVVVVVGHQAEEVSAEVASLNLAGASTVLQAEQRGTGHAVQQALPALAPGIERVLILPGDTPLLPSERLAELLDSTGPGGAVLTARMPDPTGYGRVVRAADGSVARVVEHRDATADERAIDEINSGMYVLGRGLLEEAIGRIGDDNAQGELYLTDVVELLAAGGDAVQPVLADPDEIAGVNDRSQLAAAGAQLRHDRLEHLMSEVGVTVVDPAATYVDVDVEVGADAVLQPGTMLEAGTTIGPGAVIGPNTHLTACQVGAGATVHSTRGDGASIAEGATIGPFAHLRPGTRVGRGAKVGAFAETKNALIGDRSKIPHLSYVGDATLGEDVNIACGVITVNYDGRTKAHTSVGDGAFVGCDTMLVAPVEVGAGAYTAAGSTITDDVPPGALAIARARQTVKEGWADRRRG